jgi:hypothetical protein
LTRPFTDASARGARYCNGKELQLARFKGLVVAGEVVTDIVGLGQSLRIGSAISRYVEKPSAGGRRR